MQTAIIIDDSKFMKDRLSEILDEAGVKLLNYAINGREGVELYKELEPDFVFLDINMPELTGRDALVQIINHNPNAQVVMCSTLGAEETIEECIEEGAIYYILKPFIKEKVLKALSLIGAIS